MRITDWNTQKSSDMETEETLGPLRTVRRFALSEVNERGGTPTKNPSPEERVILERGRRCKPITWSPLDYDRNKIMQKTLDKTPEKLVPRIELISSRLKRRLILSPTKPKTQSEELGSFIARKLGLIEGKDFSFFNSKKYKLQDDEMEEEMKEE